MATTKASARTRRGDDGRPADAAVKKETGQGWKQWFSILDRWGARDRNHTEIARYLTDQQNVHGWWAQWITTAYERDRGLRRKHERSGGFAISASKTVGVPVDALFKAFVDGRRRKRWLSDDQLSLRTSQANKSARFNWGDATRVNVGFIEKGPSKSTVAVEHERLAGTREAEAKKKMWRDNLAELKAFLEA